MKYGPNCPERGEQILQLTVSLVFYGNMKGSRFCHTIGAGFEKKCFKIKNEVFMAVL